MPRTRQEFDADRISEYEVADYRSTMNRYEIPCSVCQRLVFVNEDVKRDFDRGVERDLDNTFMCQDCEQEYDRLAFE